MSASYIAFNRIIAGIDDRALASFALCGRFDQIMALPVLAIASAEITMVGQNFGRRNLTRVRKIWNTCALSAAAVSGFLAATLFLLSPSLYPLFTDVDEVVALAVKQTRVVAFSHLLASAAILGRAYFQGIGRAIPGFVIDAVRFAVIPVPAAFLLAYGTGLGVQGVWLAVAAGNAGSAFVAVPWVTGARGRAPARFVPGEPSASRG
jgi:Na+-driven multidrug efflux pump